MRTTYRTLFTCKIMHTFFADNICRGVAFKQGKTTSMIARRFGILIVAGQNSFSMLTDCSSTIADFLRYIENTTGFSSFDFEMTIDDSSFNNYTDVPVDWVGQFQFNSGETIARQEETVTLKTILSNSFPPPRGVLTISFDDITGSGTPTPAYIIQFEARPTQWNYYVIVKNKEIDQESLTLKSRENVPVNGPQKVRTAGGEEAVLFSVDKLIPLSEQPRYSFDLMSTGGKQSATGGRYDRIVYRGLPAPGKNNLGVIQEGKNTLVTSPMYVYI